MASYGLLIWTKHVEKRLGERKLTKDMIYETFNSPDKTVADNEKRLFIRRFENNRVFVVTKLNEKGEYVVLSAWANPPIKGSLDQRRKEANRNYWRASPLKKIIITVLRQFGFSL